MRKIKLGNMYIEVVQKDIQNLHLSVHPPDGKVKIAAPIKMDIETIRIFAISKLSWIKKQQAAFKNQARESPRDYITRESHYYLGKRYLLRVVEADVPPKVVLKHSAIELHVRPGSDKAKRQVILESWYRQKLKEIVPAFITKWEKEMGVSVSEYGIKKMKTKWGTCNREVKRIWLNLELAKKPKECIEYIVVHEMTHLLERRHNERFVARMDTLMPQWRAIKKDLNEFKL